MGYFSVSSNNENFIQLTPIQCSLQVFFLIVEKISKTPNIRKHINKTGKESYFFFAVLRTNDKSQISILMCEWDLVSTLEHKAATASGPSPFLTFPLLRCSVKCLKFCKFCIFRDDDVFAEFGVQYVFVKSLVF